MLTDAIFSKVSENALKRNPQRCWGIKVIAAGHRVGDELRDHRVGGRRVFPTPRWRPDNSKRLDSVEATGSRCGVTGGTGCSNSPAAEAAPDCQYDPEGQGHGL